MNKVIWCVILTILAFKVEAITQEEVNEQNAAAEQACNSARYYGDLSANDILDAVSAENYKVFWGMLKDEAAYRLCNALTPKSIAELVVKHVPDLADKINNISTSSVTDAEKGKAIEELLESEMSPDYGFSNNGKASITMTPSFGVVKLSWADDVQKRSCTKTLIGYVCPDGIHGECYPTYKNIKQKDSIHPLYTVSREVNGIETVLGRVEGGVRKTQSTVIDISFKSPDTLLKTIGKEVVRNYVKDKLQSKNNNQPDAVNLFYDNFADIYKGQVKYKITASDPGGSRYCPDESSYQGFSYYLDYDVNSDGIPDFVDEQWYYSKIGPAIATMVLPSINLLLLN